MAKRQRMTMFNRNEIEQALYLFGYEYLRNRGKGDHDLFQHKDLPWFNIVIRESRDISEAVYKDVVAQLTLLCIVSERTLKELEQHNLHKLKASVEICLRNQSYKRYLYEALKYTRDENGNPYDSDIQYNKFIEKLKDEYKQKKAKEQKRPSNSKIRGDIKGGENGQ